jgi:hypothetical protein
MMQDGQLSQVVLAQAGFATISGMTLHRELRLREPAMQGFGIDAQVPTTVGQGPEGHRSSPFTRDV